MLNDLFMGWQWLNIVCAIVFLLLIAVPARRFITDENPG